MFEVQVWRDNAWRPITRFTGTEARTHAHNVRRTREDQGQVIRVVAIEAGGDRVDTTHNSNRPTFTAQEMSNAGSWVDIAHVASRDYARQIAGRRADETGNRTRVSRRRYNEANRTLAVFPVIRRPMPPDDVVEWHDRASCPYYVEMARHPVGPGANNTMSFHVTEDLARRHAYSLAMYATTYVYGAGRTLIATYIGAPLHPGELDEEPGEEMRAELDAELAQEADWSTVTNSTSEVVGRPFLLQQQYTGTVLWLTVQQSSSAYEMAQNAERQTQSANASRMRVVHAPSRSVLLTMEPGHAFIAWLELCRLLIVEMQNHLPMRPRLNVAADIVSARTTTTTTYADGTERTETWQHAGLSPQSFAANTVPAPLSASMRKPRRIRLKPQDEDQNVVDSGGDNNSVDGVVDP